MVFLYQITDKYLKPATHLAILNADRSESDRQRKSPSFFHPCGDVALLKSHDKIAQPVGLTSLAIRSDERRKSRERAHLANEFSRQYLTCHANFAALGTPADLRRS